MRKQNVKICLFLALGVLIYWKSYVIAIGQTPKPVLVALNKADATLAVIDPVEMKLIGKVATGDGPHEVVIMPDGKTAVVANYGAQIPGNSFSIIDIETRKELRRVDISPLMRPHGIIELGGKIYFTAETNRLIGRFDMATNRVDWLMGTGQNATHMVVGTPDQKRFYTANIASDTVSAIELANVPPAQSKIIQIPTGKQPEAIDISPDGKQVWIGLNAEASVEIIDTATNKSVGKIGVGERPYRVRFTPDGKSVVATIPNTKEVVVIDVATRKEIKRIKLESFPLGLIFSKDGSIAFVTTVQADEVIKIDLASGEIKGRVASGAAPDGIAVAGI